MNEDDIKEKFISWKSLKLPALVPEGELLYVDDIKEEDIFRIIQQADKSKSPGLSGLSF